jgi:hypothetical protein
MQNINSETDLRVAILQLESKQAEEGKLLKEQALLAYDSVKPINILKNAFMEATTSSDLKDNIINRSVGMTAGYLSKIAFQGLTKSPVKKLIGTVLMFGIKNVVAKNPDTVKLLGKGFFTIVRSFLRKHEKRANNNKSR